MEKLTNSIIEFVTAQATIITGNQIMGNSIGALSKIWINNMIDKHKFILSGFTDENGELIDYTTFFKSFKDILKNNPLEIMGIRFNDKDVDELMKIYEKNI